MHCSMDQMDHFCVALQHDARTKKKSKLLLWTLSPTASPTFGAMSCSTDACSVYMSGGCEVPVKKQNNNPEPGPVCYHHPTEGARVSKSVTRSRLGWSLVPMV